MSSNDSNPKGAPSKGAQSERLQKRLARAGVASRRASEELIRDGRVTVNGVLAHLGQVVSARDQIKVDGHLVTEQVEAVTFLLYKPRGYVSSVRDEWGRKTVISAMPEVAGLHPVGRLDKDSEGLLLLTTDGNLTQQLTHPRYGHQKAYRAWVGGPDDDELVNGDAEPSDSSDTSAPSEPSDAELARLIDGIELNDGLAQALDAWSAPQGAHVVLGEGRNRQVRRMLSELGYPVRRLLRYRIGGLWLENMEVGEYQELNDRDLQDLLHPERIPKRVWQAKWSLVQRRWG